MSQIGKLYRYYLEKIWQKNWLRIIIFTILIGVVWWFVLPWLGAKTINSSFGVKKGKETNFSEISNNQFKDKVVLDDDGLITIDRVLVRKWLENEKGWEKDIQNSPNFSNNIKGSRALLQIFDSGSFLGIMSNPYSSNNAFFFSKTEEYSKGKDFWKLLFDISWWNLTGFITLYWFIFEIFDKIFFPSRQEGGDDFVLTITPGVKRSDLIWSKILAFLTFYSLINIAMFLIPFSVYYFWLGKVSYSWFALLTLVTIFIGPLLFFGLIFIPYLFFGSLTGSKWIFSTLITFSPIIWGIGKAFSSSSWPYEIERFFFNPIWFTIISLFFGIFFLTLQYSRYQNEDLN
ncbi:MAG: hypothetical protein mread185_000020 [Mycoplasmataceae bacterium]|nr:MAG: hypothetical protein mread185_000020 [Mycoplasmataceae bacterium]